MKKESETTSAKKKENETRWKIGTWNIRSIKGKEQELVQEFKQAKLDILAISETKKKGQGIIEMEGGHILIYSGVHVDSQAKEGVACLIKPEHVNKITNWEGINGRILKLEIKLQEKGNTTIIIAYGPNEDDSINKKDLFWEEMEGAIEDVSGRLIIMGDLNGRVGKRGEGTPDVIGVYGERCRNNNGSRLIHFCIENNLIITNTFYKHKEIHQYTREVPTRKEKSIIDYVLISRHNRKEVLNVRVRRGPEIYSDHYLVEAKLQIKKEVPNQSRQNTKLQKSEAIKAYKLRTPEVGNIYKTIIQERKVETIFNKENGRKLRKIQGTAH